MTRESADMEWKIEYIKEAQRDLKNLDPYNRKLVLKAIIVIKVLTM